MNVIKCLGKFNYGKYKVVAIVKITETSNKDKFMVNKYYPIIYNFDKKTYCLIDNRSDINKYFYCNRNIDNILRKLISTGYTFDYSYYINYVIYDQKCFGKCSFTISFTLKSFNNKIVSKSIEVF